MKPAGQKAIVIGTVRKSLVAFNRAGIGCGGRNRTRGRRINSAPDVPAHKPHNGRRLVVASAYSESPPRAFYARRHVAFGL